MEQRDGNSRTNLPTGGGRDGGSADMDLFRGRFCRDDRDDRLGIPCNLGRKKRAGNLEGVEREIINIKEVIWFVTSGSHKTKSTKDG